MDLPQRQSNLPDGNWIPNCDFWASKSNMVVLVELAGVRSGDIEIEVQGNSLRIIGNRSNPALADGTKKMNGGIKFGRFSAILELPSGYDLTGSKAAYMNGFLRIDVPADARAPA
jgi:HSP20 family molecular chaperone IbpA